MAVLSHAPSVVLRTQQDVPKLPRRTGRRPGWSIGVCTASPLGGSQLEEVRHSGNEYGGGVCRLRKRIAEQHIRKRIEEQHAEAAPERLLGPGA